MAYRLSSSVRPAQDRFVETAKTDQAEEWRQAVLLWMRWNDAYERVTEAMFQAGSDQQRVQDLADQLDKLRATAIAQSHKLLDSAT
jgi:small-conductance mechanosensitive channel